jgi:hypothetical protein
MAYFAKIGLNNKVIEVLSVVNEVLYDANGIEQESIGIDFLTKLTGWAIWKKTSYNTISGIYYNIDSQGNREIGNQEKSFRKNFAGIGYTYDEDRDAFISPKPFNSWLLNESTCNWESPVAKPEDENEYIWNEQNQSWDLA